MKILNKLLLFLICPLIFIADRITKLWAMYYIIPYNSIKVYSFFNISLKYNTGIAFSLFDNTIGKSQRWIFILISIVFSILIIYSLNILKYNIKLKIILLFILGGILGNLYDRIFYGMVIDFLDLHYSIWHYATFNIADVAICIGMGMLALLYNHD